MLLNKSEMRDNWEAKGIKWKIWKNSQRKKKKNKNNL